MNPCFPCSAGSLPLFFPAAHAIASTQRQSSCLQKYTACFMNCQGRKSCGKNGRDAYKACSTACNGSLFDDCPLKTPSSSPVRDPAGAPNALAGAIVGQRRVSDAAVQACRSRRGIEHNHRLLNRPGEAMKRAGP